MLTPVSPVPPAPVRRIHGAARFEDAVEQAIERRLRQRAWQPKISAYTGYGGTGWVRVMGRVLLVPPPDPDEQPRQVKKVRGWRSFATLPVKHAEVIVNAAGERYRTHTDRSGFVDCVLKADLSPGWGKATLTTADAEDVDAPVRILEPDARFGIVSDIDDTVMVTALPRPLLAAWNTFVLDEHARAAVPGMAVLYERLTRANPGAPVMYLSTGAWNVAPTLTRFLSRHLYPAGPLLLTDWGPTPDRWFRSGRDHKRATLARLAREFPKVRWLLIGDDGQHDQEIYAEFARAHPENVAAVAIRRLSPTQAVLAGAVPNPPGGGPTAPLPPSEHWLCAPDGAGLWHLLREAGLV